GITGTIVFRAEQGVNDPEVRAAIEAYFARFDARDDVTIASPYTAEGAFQIAAQGPHAGKIAYADIEMPPETTWSESQELGKVLLEEVPELDGLQVEIGGQSFAEFEEPSSEVVGLAFAIVILIVSFGSVLAMGLPV